MMRCLNCGFENLETLRFCEGCGSNLKVEPDSLDVGAPPQETPSAPPGQTPLHGSTFVGREAEMGRLQAAFDGASSGDGSLFMVVGEPGIGKTTLCEQFAAYVQANGGTTLVGHCYEEGSLSLPYLAFVEAMGSYVVERDVDELKEELGPGVGDLARIVPEVRDRLGVEPTPPSDPDQDRYQFLQAASTFLRNASSAQPLLIVLEDLHDADSGTLDMLNHVARNLSGSHLLMVGTYRDVGVDRAHPLSGALVELRRVSAFGRVALRGLSADEVHRMMGGLTEQEVSGGLVEAVHRQTEGNPLFVQEVQRYLEEEGLLAGEDARWQATGQTPLELGIPEGLRDVIGKRLTRLSEECNRVLSMAAVIGRDLSLQVLQEVAALPEDELFATLEEAQSAGIIEERSSVGAGVGFRFAHALFRQTLYEETFAPRRLRLHQQVGRALEEVYAGHPEEHAAEMAEHFAQSTEREDLEKALKYGEVAAEQAIGVYAYGEAARLLAQALQVQEVLAPDDRARRCDLLLALGGALTPAGEPRRVYDTVAPEAFALAEAMDDCIRLSRTCVIALDAINRYGAGWRWRSPEFRRWAERADEYSEPETTDRVSADDYMHLASLAEDNLTGARAFIIHAIELARRLDDANSLFSASFSFLFGISTPPLLEEERWRLVTEMEGRATVGVTPRTLGKWLFAGAMVSLDWGERGRAEVLLGDLGRLAQRSGDADLLFRSLFAPLFSAFLDGRLTEALSVIERLNAWADETGSPGIGRVLALLYGYRPFLHVGRGGRSDSYIVRVRRGAIPIRATNCGECPPGTLRPS